MDAPHDELKEDIEDMPNHQTVFDGLLEDYLQGNEPLESWDTEDLVRMLDAIDRELQNRNLQREEVHAERDSIMRDLDLDSFVHSDSQDDQF